MKSIHVEAVHVRAEDPHQRLGQAYFNAAHKIDPVWADGFRGTSTDPFYNDDALARFLMYWHENHA